MKSYTAPRHFVSGGAEHYLCWHGRRYLLIGWKDGTWDAFGFFGQVDVLDERMVREEHFVERALTHGGPAGERVRRAMVPWTHEHEALWERARVA